MGGFLKRFFKRDGQEPTSGRVEPKTYPATVEQRPPEPVAAPAPVFVPPVVDVAPAQPVAAVVPVTAPAVIPVQMNVPSVPIAPVVAAAPVAAAVPVVIPAASPAPIDQGSSLIGIEPAHTLSVQDETRLCGAEVTAAQLTSDDPSLRYDPAAHLVTALREAYLVSRKWQVPTRLDTDAGVITVDSVHNRMYLEFSEARLMQLCVAPLDKRPKTRTLGLQEAAAIRATLEQESKSNDLYTCRVDATLWRAGMETARGRLPLGVNPGKTVYLKHWPNMTRLLCTPHALRVAAVWATRGATPLETSSQLGVSLRHVMAVYNAALALDLVTEDGAHIRRAQRKAHRNRGLLTRLFTWLHR
jgi:hypothetical protein